MAFIIKKVVTQCLLPPGIFIILLLLASVFLKRRGRFLALFFALFIYILSIGPTGNLLLMPLENSFPVPSLEEVKTGDAYVVLGGGVYDNAPDVDGKGALSGDSLARLLTAYKLYRICKKPIILSGGRIFGRGAEADIAKRTLLSLGAGEQDIIAEPKSIDTRESAQFVREVSDKHKISRIVLITSAYHMKRSHLLFSRHFREIIPYPAGYLASRVSYDVLSFLPSAAALEDVAVAMKEYMGIVFYKIKP
ncbi:MAG: YdcF family protein [Syntrophorhabdaceae bacterium]|nr:YdcF family protein [Syntrophorhabdaceae bacterium]